jgi:hypothetical protein
MHASAGERLWEYLHVIVHDSTRLAQTEVLKDET